MVKHRSTTVALLTVLALLITSVVPGPQALAQETTATTHADAGDPEQEEESSEPVGTSQEPSSSVGGAEPESEETRPDPIPGKGRHRQAPSGEVGVTAVSFQTISSPGPLSHIYLGAELSCQVRHVNDDPLEFFPPSTIPGDCGTLLVLGDVLYAPDFGNHGITATGNLGSYTPFTPVSQSAVTGSGTSSDPYQVTTVAGAGDTDVRITQVDSYVVGETSYRTDITVSNSGASSQAIILYRAGDCYLAGSDFGHGAVVGTSVACSGTPNNDPPGRIEQWVPITGGNNYYEAFYSQVWSEIGAKAPFNDTCRCDEFMDNGAGISWNLSVPAGGETSVSHRLRFTSVLPVEPAPAGTESNNHPNTATSRDPVNTLTGSYTYSSNDLEILGRGPTPAFTRTYNSNDTRTGPLGAGWTHNYATHLADPGDGTGDVILVTPAGRSDRYTQNPDGSYAPPSGIHTTLVRTEDGTYTATHKDQTGWIFGADGKLYRIRDRYGNESQLSYNDSGQLVSVSDPAGRGSLSFSYDSTTGLLVSVSDWLATPRVVEFGYDTEGRLLSVTDREGNTTGYGYDGTSHRLTTITDARGNTVVTNTYDTHGRVATQKNAQGLVTGEQTTFSYTTSTDGTKTSLVTYPATSFDSTWHPTQEDSYDTNGWLSQRVIAPSSTESHTTVFGYDSIGNRTAVTDPRGNTTNFCYDVDRTGAAIADSRGNLTRRIDPAPTSTAARPVTLFTYDTADNLVELVPPRGVASGGTLDCSTDLSAAVDSTFATDFGYDTTQTELVSVTRRYTDPDAGAQTAVTKLEYGDAANPGVITRLITPRGNTGSTPDYSYATTLSYYSSGSQAGMLESETDPVGNQTTFGYDPVGRLVSVVDPNGHVSGATPSDHRWEYSYDSEDRVRFVTAPAPESGGGSLVTELRYDAVGNTVVLIDANGQVTRNLYDERNLLQQVWESPETWSDPAVEPSSKFVTSYVYDHLGNLTQVTRADGDATYERATRYLYDGFDRLREERQHPAWPDTAGALITVHGYDANGNRDSLVDPSGQSTAFSFDGLDRLTSIDYSDAAAPDVGYVYDANGNRTQMTDGTGTTSYVYDELDRITSVMFPAPATVGYRYDLDGNRTKLIYPDGTAVSYSFDAAGRLSLLTDWAARTVSYDYLPDGNLQQATNPNGTIATYGYDNALRLTEVANTLAETIISQHTYTLDAVGNRTRVDENLATLGSTGNGTSQAWGRNSQGQLGNGTTNDSPTPVDVADLTGIVEIGAGGEHSLAALSDGTAWAWGQNAYGQLGDGTATDRTTPVQVSGLSGVTAVDGGLGHSLALRDDGTVWSWGLNANGQLGDGTSNDSSVPVQVTGLSGAVAIAAGGDHSLALLSDGTVWAWGKNSDGQLGNGSKKKQLSPVQVSGLSGVTTIGAGDAHSLAVASDGSVWAWGDNFFGQLGDGTTRDRTSPVQVSGLPGAGTVAGGAFHSLAVASDGTVWAWGRNSFGQLGDGTTTDRTTPVQVTGVAGAGGVSAGAHHSLAVVSDGSVWAWGLNLYGQLGDGTTTSSSVPVQTTGVSDAIGVAAGAFHSLSVSGSGGTTSLSIDYGHDWLYQLTSADSSLDGLTTYDYDPVGNRLSMSRDGTTTDYVYDKADRIESAGAVSYTVDADGNLVARGGDSFGYDQADRLTSTDLAGTVASYVYDGDGNRQVMVVGTEPAVEYVYDVAGALAVVLGDGDRKYVWGLGLAYTVDSSDAASFYHADGLGSVRALTAGDGTLVQTHRSDEFGVPIASEGGIDQPFRFTGEQFDAHSGLVYLRARYYLPEVGRFLTRDPHPGRTVDPITLNPYTYAHNRPVVLTDPLGEFPWSEGWCVFGDNPDGSCRGSGAVDFVQENPEEITAIATGGIAFGVCVFTAGIGCAFVVGAGFVLRGTVTYTMGEGTRGERLTRVGVDALLTITTLSVGGLIAEAGKPIAGAAGRFLPGGRLLGTWGQRLANVVTGLPIASALTVKYLRDILKPVAPVVSAVPLAMGAK